jgi:two-component system response regulator YesN
MKSMLGLCKTTLVIIMENSNLDFFVKSMTETCQRISETLPLLSADSNFQRIISYVKNNYSENLNLDSLAQLFYYNSAYLGKRFKKYTGIKFQTYLDKLRIDTAIDLLQNTNMKIYEISIAVGYSNTDYFYSKFKKYTGKSPLVYKKTGDHV